MSYDIHLNIPEDSKRGHLIAFLAAEQHISPNEVVERMIDQAVDSQSSPSYTEDGGGLTDQEKQIAAEAADARRHRSTLRQARKNEIVRSRPDTPDTFIGFLADSPEIAENIRMLANERRSQAYGNR